MPARGTYRGIYSSLLDDPGFQELSSNSRHVFLSIRLSQDVGPAGIFRYYTEPISHRTGLTLKQVNACLEELASENWIAFDGACMWLRNALRYDPNMRICDKKHLVRVERWLQSLPPSEIVIKFCDYYKIRCPFDAPSERYPTGEGRGRGKGVGKGEGFKIRSLSSGEDPHVEAAASKEPGNGKDISVTPECLMQMYNDLTPEYVPSVETMKGKRLERAKRYLRMFPAREWWEETFRQYHASRFLSGKVPPNPGHESWRPDFDWLLSTDKQGMENCVKVHDGRYADG